MNAMFVIENHLFSKVPPLLSVVSSASATKQNSAMSTHKLKFKGENFHESIAIHEILSLKC